MPQQISETDEFTTPVFGVATNDLAEPDITNLSAKALANRTLHLKNRLDALSGDGSVLYQSSFGGEISHAKQADLYLALPDINVGGYVAAVGGLNFPQTGIYRVDVSLQLASGIPDGNTLTPIVGLYNPSVGLELDPVIKGFVPSFEANEMVQMSGLLSVTDADAQVLQIKTEDVLVVSPVELGSLSSITIQRVGAV